MYLDSDAMPVRTEEEIYIKYIVLDFFADI
jgi:hypothetical protein